MIFVDFRDVCYKTKVEASTEIEATQILKDILTLILKETPKEYETCTLTIPDLDIYKSYLVRYLFIKEEKSNILERLKEKYKLELSKSPKRRESEEIIDVEQVVENF